MVQGRVCGYDGVGEGVWVCITVNACTHAG